MPEGAGEEGGELGLIHLARGHREFAVPDRPEPADMAVDRHVVWRVGEDHRGPGLAHEHAISLLVEGTAAMHPVRTEEPGVAGPGHRRPRGDRQRHIVGIGFRRSREAEAFFDEYQTLTKAGEKEALAVKICLALAVHTRIEEEIFYPAVRGAIDNQELIDEALVEHTAAKQLISEIEAMEVSDHLLDAKVKVFGEQTQYHVEEEENELFPQLQNSKLDVDDLGSEMAALKQELVAEVIEGGDAL
jgi:hypothetical protein